MKDELPDLTPYLNKKGGNSQGRGEEPAGKTDISQKLSALVKKPGTSTGTHTSVAAAADAAQAHADQASVADKSTTGDMEQPGSNGAGQAQSVSSWDDAADESPIGIVRPSAPAPAPAPAPSSVEDSSARWGAIARSGNPELFSTSNESQNAPSPAPAEAPPAVAEGYTGSSSSPSREMARPGPAVPLGQDKLKGPQAKPMSTLSSSSAPPLLKQPPKTPGRPAQPYSYKPVIEPGREAMAPKAPSSAPVNRAPQPVATPKPAQPVPPSSSVQSGPVQSAPAPSNASPPSQSGSSAPPGP
ncbi:MAG: hypothetical protein JSS86_15670, partial [Cyanobacteria bacterium SZAS LIN-2]|nr:hypothetical protein [Cyanobacteria bacterium SZAS LIN-2]